MGRMCSSRYERLARQRGWLRIAGVDEAGRGALFGPVVAAAVILDPARHIPGLDDSKKLSPARRAVLAERIRERARAWAVGQVESGRIDAWNILENDPEYERSEEDQPFDPDVFSRREVNARLRQYTKGDRDWLFSY